MTRGNIAAWSPIIVLTAGVALELWWPSPGGNHASRAITPAPPPVSTAASPDRSEHDAADALARPLFIEGRRPPSAAVARAAAAPAETLPRLSGVMIAGRRRLAIFEIGDRSVSGGVGDAVGVQRIVAITPASVTLQGPFGVRTLSLAFDPKPALQPAAPPPSILDQLNSGQRAPAAMPKAVTVEDLMATLPKTPMNLAGAAR